MKDIRGNRLIDGDLVLLALDSSLEYGVIFKETLYFLKDFELRTVEAISNKMDKIISPSGNEVSKRKEILQVISNCGEDEVAVMKSTKLSGKKKFVETPFIQSITNCITLNISNGGPYRFKSRDKESLEYVKLYSRETAEYIGNIINKKLTITVKNNEIIVELTT